MHYTTCSSANPDHYGEETFCLDSSKDDKKLIVRAKSHRICLLLHTKLKYGAHDAKRDRFEHPHRPARLHVCGSGGTSNDLDQLAGNDSLSGTVEQDLEFVDHVTSVLGGVVHGVATGRLLAGVALGKSLFVDVSISWGRI